MNISNLTTGLTLALSLTTAANSMAGECPSMLKQALKPITEDSAVEWAAELTLRIGHTDANGYDRDFNNEMALLGLGWQSEGIVRVYVEGGVKYWNRSGLDGTGITTYGRGNGDNHQPVGGDDWAQKEHAGFREAYVEFSPDGASATIGLQAMSAGDPLLLDERVLGAYAAYEQGQFLWRGGLGTVSDDFSRMGKFCGTRHNYRPLQDYYRDPIGSNLGDYNLGFINLAWRPDQTPADAGMTDEFESFEAIDDFAPIDSAGGQFRLSELGVTCLNEFGDGFTNSALFAAGYMKVELPLHVGFDGEVVSQWVDGNTALAWLVALEKNTDFAQLGTLFLRGGYLGAPDSGSPNERFSPSFANLFLGDVLKLDAVHAPLWYTQAMFTVPTAWPLHAGVMYVAQTADNHAGELDVELGFHPHFELSAGNFRPFENMSIRAIYSQVQADDLPDDLTTWKLEVRWAF